MAKTEDKNTVRQEFEQSFPTKLRELLDKTRRTQKNLAEKVGVARQTVSQWTLGTTIPDIYQLKKIAKYFNVSYQFLLDDISTEKIENIDIGQQLGLSDIAVDFLKHLKKRKTESLDVVNWLLNFRIFDVPNFSNCAILKIAEYFNLNIKTDKSDKVAYIFNKNTKDIRTIYDSDLLPDEAVEDLIDSNEIRITIDFLEELLLKEIIDLLKKEKGKYKNKGGV